MIRQTMVPPLTMESKDHFLKAVSESLQGVMQDHERECSEGGKLDIRAFGPLVFVRYEGKAQSVALPFKPDGNMPLACNRGTGNIIGNRMEFGSNEEKIAWGWCISSGRIRQ